MWKRILWERSGGHYLFYASAIYLTVGMYNIFIDHFTSTESIQVAWIFALAGPFIIPPMGRYFNMDVTWDQRMFNKLFGKKDKLPENVVQFPELKSAPPVPEVKPPKAEKEEPAKIFYRFGLTDNNRVAFSMGYSEITMNYQGCEQMIEQIRFFQGQLYDENGPTDDPDGGLPLPDEAEIKDKKAA